MMVCSFGSGFFNLIIDHSLERHMCKDCDDLMQVGCAESRPMREVPYASATLISDRRLYHKVVLGIYIDVILLDVFNCC